MDKKNLREIMINTRNEINLEEKKLMDEKIKYSLKNTSLYKKSKNIFIYIGFGSEIDTSSYIEEFLLEGKNILVPRTEPIKKIMEAVKIDSLDSLEKSNYGILEPKKNLVALNKDEIDLIIMPGVAFDIKGGRVGYGGGYYDKYLEDINNIIPKIALAYDFQVLGRVPTEEHDIRVDFIITENREINLLQYT